MREETDKARADALDQEEVFAFLADPATHGLQGEVGRVDTHGAALFLAGCDVYKAKRAVRFPFMDFSTLEKRRAACEAEIAFNRPNAPQLYLGVVPVTRMNGRLRLGGDGEVVEWTAHLARFDEDAGLDRIAARGELDPPLARRLGETIARAHHAAPVRRESGAVDRLRRVIEEMADGLVAASDHFGAKAARDYGEDLRAAFSRVAPLLSRREARGRVRRCHGDLHLANIVLINGEPTLFDALEFDETLATIDVLYDLAFALMDLWTRRLPQQANALMNACLSAGDDMEGDIEGLAALPLFMSLRAAIRARVATLEPDPKVETLRSALALFKAARAFLAPCGARLVAVGGLSGTGKTRLGAAIAHAIGATPGAVHLRSDVERKRLHGARELDRLPPEAYGPEQSARVYARLMSLASIALRAGRGVVVDAAFLKERERTDAQALDRSAQFDGLWLEAPLAERLTRVARRRDDASDATEEVARAQETYVEDATSWTRLDAGEPPQIVARRALEILSNDQPTQAVPPPVGRGEA